MNMSKDKQDEVLARKMTVEVNSALVDKCLSWAAKCDEQLKEITALKTLIDERDAIIAGLQAVTTIFELSQGATKLQTTGEG